MSINGERLIRDGATATLRRLRSLMSGGRWVDKQREEASERERREKRRPRSREFSLFQIEF
jgi:hypothetical protein